MKNNNHSDLATTADPGAIKITPRIPNQQLLRVSCLLLVLGVVFNETPISLWISERFADGVNGFPWRDQWLTSTVFHSYANKVTALIAIALILFNLKQWIRPTVSRRLIGSGRYLMCVWMLSALTISELKAITTLPCPWDLQMFGGTREYLSLLHTFSSAYPAGSCFPSGHSSGGWGMIGLGFVALLYGRSMFKGFLPAIVIGVIYGSTQIVRGAHLVSHELFTVAICLGYAWFLANFYLFPRFSLQRQTDESTTTDAAALQNAQI